MEEHAMALSLLFYESLFSKLSLYCTSTCRAVFRMQSGHLISEDSPVINSKEQRNTKRADILILELTSLEAANLSVCPVRHLATYLRSSSKKRNVDSQEKTIAIAYPEHSVIMNAVDPYFVNEMSDEDQA
ncbi:hypothetical protein ACTFIU_002118 [Dictyostelium citrinum]